MDSGDGNLTRKTAGDVVTISFPSDSDSNCPADLGSGGLLSSWLIFPSAKFLAAQVRGRGTATLYPIFRTW